MIKNNVNDKDIYKGTITYKCNCRSWKNSNENLCKAADMEKVESHHDIQGKADGPNQGFDMVVDGLVTVADQVWSLTQFYSVN